MNLDPEKLETLIAYLRGTLEPSEVESLEDELKDGGELRKYLLELSIEEAVLAEWAKTENVAVELEDEVFRDDAVPPGEKTSLVPFPASFFRTNWIAAAAVVALLGVVGAFWMTNNQNVITSPGVAQLVASADADWNGNAPGLNAPMPAGNYQLDLGSINLVFTDGAKVSLSGPAAFELKSTRHIHLISGNLVAQIPDEALGFIVTSPQSEVVDLGTEFGLSVSESGNTDVHVLDGLVEVLSGEEGGGNDPGVQIEAGNALRFGKADQRAPVEIPVNSREDLLGNRRVEGLGLQMLRGSVRIAESVSKSDLKKNPVGPNRIDLIAEKTDVILGESLAVTIKEPGNYRNFSGSGGALPAGTRVTSYLLHFRPSNFEPVFGVIRFDQPIVGILSSGDHLFASDELFGVPSVHYPEAANSFRGLEPAGGQTAKWKDRPDWQPDEIILSQDQRTLAIRAMGNAEKGYDQIRILTRSVQTK